MSSMGQADGERMNRIDLIAKMNRVFYRRGGRQSLQESAEEEEDFQAAVSDQEEDEDADEGPSTRRRKSKSKRNSRSRASAAEAELLPEEEDEEEAPVAKAKENKKGKRKSQNKSSRRKTSESSDAGWSNSEMHFAGTQPPCWCSHSQFWLQQSTPLINVIRLSRNHTLCLVM